MRPELRTIAQERARIRLNESSFKHEKCKNKKNEIPNTKSKYKDKNG